jgi:hypothetical protein
LPDATIVDVTHDIGAFAVREAELCLRAYAFAFAQKTVHLVIVDPGVGTRRRPIAVQAADRFFVGPDNGVLGVALATPGAQVVELTRSEFFRPTVSATFHGRDIFAPVAAALAAGRTLDEVGTPFDAALPSRLPVAEVHADVIRGEVLAADKFGNLATNIAMRDLGQPLVLAGTSVDAVAEARAGWQVSVLGEALPWHATYGEAAPGELFALAGSDGFLELALCEGSASARVGAAVGLAVECTRRSR